MRSAALLARAILFLLAAALGICSLATADCSDNRRLLLQYNLASQSARHIFERWDFVPGIVGQLQAYTITRDSSSTTVAVCLLPPLEWNPSLDRVGQLLGNIWNSTDFETLFVYNRNKACYTSLSDPNTCEKIVFISHSDCLDANLIVSSERIDLWMAKLRGNLGGLLLQDSGATWTQLASVMTDLISSLDITSRIVDATDITIERLAEDLVVRSSIIPGLLASLQPIGPILQTRVLEYDLDDTFEKLKDDYMAEWTEIGEIVLDDETSLTSLSPRHLIPQQQAILRDLVSSYSLACLEIVSSFYRHLAEDLKSTSSALNIISSLSSSNSRLESYKPKNMVSMLQKISSSYFGFFSSLLRSIRSQRSSSEWPRHFLDCFEQQMSSIQRRYNDTLFSISGEYGLLDLLCTSGVTQEFGLFLDSPLQMCLFGALTNDLRYITDTNDSTSFDLSIISTHFGNVEKSMRNLSNGLVTSRWKMGPIFNISSNPSYPCNSDTGVGGSAELISTIGALDLPVSFHPSPLPDLYIRGQYHSQGSIMTINYNSSSSFTIDTENVWSAISSSSKRISARRSSLKQSHVSMNHAESCSSGFFSSYNNVSGLFTCKECPEGYFCLGTDGLKRLCSNGPLDRVIYTQRGQTNSSCPFRCSSVAECRKGDECVVPGLGEFCLAWVLQNCSLPPLPSQWTYQNQCQSQIHHLAYIASPLDGDKNATQCPDSPFSSAMDALTRIPSYNFDLAITIRIDDLNTSASTSPINLAYSPGKYRLNMELAGGMNSRLVFVILSASDLPLREYRTTVPMMIEFGKWNRVRIQVSELNYLTMSLNNRIVFYDFYDSSAQTQGSSSQHTQKLLFGSVEPSSGLQKLSYSLQSLVFSNSNLSRFSDYFNALPDNLTNYGSYYCDLETSYLTETGECAPLKCPGDSMERIKFGPNLQSSFCICNKSESNTCERALYTSSSDTACPAGAYMTWKGRFIRITVLDGSGFISDILVNDMSGNVIKPSRCSDLDRVGLTCSAALLGMTTGGWRATMGTSALFFLPDQTLVSTISIKSRADRLPEDDLTSLQITLEVAMSNSLSKLLSYDFDSVLTDRWAIQPNLVGTALDSETYDILDAASAQWTWKTQEKLAPDWTDIIECSLCPSGSLTSLSPRTNILDCLCQNGHTPGFKNGCEPLETENCDFVGQTVFDPLPGLYSPPLTLRFLPRNLTTWNSSVNDTITMDLLVKSGDGDTASLSHFWLRPFQSVTLNDPSNLTYSIICAGQSNSPRNTSYYDIQAKCPTPVIISSIGGGSTTSSPQKVVSLFWNLGSVGGGSQNSKIQAEISVDYNFASSGETSFPEFSPYSSAMYISSDAVVRARTISVGPVALCSNSSITKSFISLRPSTTSPSTPTSENNHSCGASCVGMIVAITTLGLIVIGLTLLVLYRMNRAYS